MNIEQGIMNIEMGGSYPSSFDIPCSIFIITPWFVSHEPPLRTLGSLKIEVVRGTRTTV
jgi:hypothetical protein